MEFDYLKDQGKLQLVAYLEKLRLRVLTLVLVQKLFQELKVIVEELMDWVEEQ